MTSRLTRSRVRLAATVAAIVLLAGLAAACGGGGDDTGGSASSELLTVEQVKKAGTSAPKAAVTRLFFFAQWGSAPNVVGAYSPGTVRSLGAANIAAAYAVLRPQLLASRPRLTGEIETNRGVLVNVELQREGSPPQRESVLVRERGGEWLVVYDSFLARGLELSVRLDSGEIDAKRVPASAVREARTVVRSYYRLADEESRADTEPRERRGSDSAGSSSQEDDASEPAG